jgi:hypothetical protein
MLVLVLSRFVLFKDVPCHSSVITYLRKIITSYGRMTNTPYHQCLNAFATLYQRSAYLWRRVIGCNLFVKPTVPWKLSKTQSEIDFGIFLRPCHFNLHHYLFSFIHFLKELPIWPPHSMCTQIYVYVYIHVCAYAKQLLWGCVATS